MYKYKIVKIGRKWFHGEQEGTGYKAQIEINESSKDFKLNEIAEFEAKIDKSYYRGHVKISLYPYSVEQVKEIEKEKEHEQIEKWIGYVEKNQDRVYTNGVNALSKFELNDEQKKRLDKAIEIATINQSISRINDYLYYIKNKINDYSKWYEAGENVVNENINMLKKYDMNTSEYVKKLDDLKTLYKNIKKETERYLAERYFTLQDISFDKNDNYEVGEIVKNKDGRIGKIVKTWKYYEADTMCFGYMVDGGWLKNAKCDTESVSEKEKAEYEEKEKEYFKKEEEREKNEALKSELNKNINDLFKYVENNGKYETNKGELMVVVGDVLFDNFDAYGGGKRIVIIKNKIWSIKNNGGDGDMWSLNNIKTGGAGAIGHYLDVNNIIKNYISEIKKLEKEIIQ